MGFKANKYFLRSSLVGCREAHLKNGDQGMTIDTERLSELLFKEVLYDNLFGDEEFKEKDITLQSFEWADNIGTIRDIKSPIEKLMYSILLNCNNGWSNFVSLSDLIYPFWFSTYIHIQYEIGKYNVDFMLDTEITDKENPYKVNNISKIVIECDGHEFHEKTKEQAKRDKERDRYLVSQGYKVLHYTGSEIYNNFDNIREEISILVANDILNFSKSRGIII